MNDYLQKLAKRYEANPIIRGLLQLIPYGLGSAADAAIQAIITRYQATRLEAFFEELGTPRVQLSPELIDNDDFLHCYFTTVRAVLRSRRRQKARYLARLLNASFSSPEFRSLDEYDDLLAIIDELSYRELLALSLLSKYERGFPPGLGENDLQRSERFWKSYVSDLTGQAGLPAELLDGFLIRLARTGLYELFTGYVSGPLGGRGKLTDLYYRLEQVAGSFAEVAA